MAKLPYMAPAQLISLRNKAGHKLSVGDTLSFHEGDISMEGHPTFGLIPVLTVLSVKDDGRLGDSSFTCACGEEVVVHPGDVFQKRRCPKCQKTHQGKAKRGIRTPEDEVKAAAEKDAKKAAKEAEKATKKYEDAIAKAKKAAEDAEARLAKLQEDAEAKRKLIEDEAARQGVAVSDNAVV